MTTKESRLRTLLYRALLFLLLTIAPTTGWGQTKAPAPAPLPPAAQEAVNKGIIAARVPDYLLAIGYFEEARQLAPQAPVIYLNLGLAESKIPGRELRAIAWFGAYLAAYPKAPNAAAVKEQIAVLEVKNKSNVLRVLKSTQDAASQLPDSAGDYALHDLAWLYAKAGDIPTAMKIAASIEDPTWQRIARDNIAEVAAERDGSGLPRPGRLPIDAPDYYRPYVMEPSFWVAQLESDKGYAIGLALNTPPFLNLAEYLASGRFLDVMKGLPIDQDPQRISVNDLKNPKTIYYGFFAVAQTLALGQYEIERMLKMLYAELPR